MGEDAPVDPTDLLQRLAAPPLFILGTASSGSNWVYEVLTAHPEVAGTRESWLFEDLAGAPPEEARSRSTEVLSEALGPGHRFVVEKSTAHIFRAGEIFAAWPEARFVHVLRDGRDVAIRVWFRSSKLPPRWVHVFGKSLGGAADAWARSVDAARSLRELATDNFLEITFEDSNIRRRAAAARLLAFIGAPFDDDLLDDILSTDDHRLDKPVDLNAWKEHYSIWRALRFHQVAGETLIKTHYEDDKTWWFKPFKRF
ncbi:MAG: sulfotransferase family protein [Actinomycetota bacterium]